MQSSFYTHKLFTHRSFYPGTPLHRTAFYTQELRNTGAFKHGCFAQRKGPLHREAIIYTQVLFPRDALTQRIFSAKQLLNTHILHTEATTHRQAVAQNEVLHTEAILNTDALTHRSFYTKKLLHTKACRHSSFYRETFTRKRPYTDTQKHLHREAFRLNSFYTQKLLHTEAVTHRSPHTAKPSQKMPFYTQKLLRTGAFTHRSA